MREEFPDLLNRLQKNDVRVDVEQRVHLLQDQLDSRSQNTPFVKTQRQLLKGYRALSGWNQREPTGKKSLWEAQGLKSFFHSFALSLGKVMG